MLGLRCQDIEHLLSLVGSKDFRGNVDSVALREASLIRITRLKAHRRRPFGRGDSAFQLGAEAPPLGAASGQTDPLLDLRSLQFGQPRLEERPGGTNLGVSRVATVCPEPRQRCHPRIRFWRPECFLYSGGYAISRHRFLRPPSRLHGLPRSGALGSASCTGVLSCTSRYTPFSSRLP